MCPRAIFIPKKNYKKTMAFFVTCAMMIGRIILWQYALVD